MSLMRRREFTRAIDSERIRQAIKTAEQRTSGEIRVSIASFFWGRIRPVAEHTFRRLGMTKTVLRNGILFFIVPSRRRFIVLGDEGIHAKVGQDFWEKVSAAMSADFREGRFQEGLIKAIGEAGERLAAHFPFDASSDKNELADDVDFQ